MPMFVETPVATIPPLHNRLHSTFSSLKTYPLEYRLEQLNKLYWAIKDNEQLLADALHADFRKPYHEVYITEINWLETAVLGIMKNLRGWAKDQPIKGVPMTTSLFNKPKMRSEPLGVVLIIGYDYISLNEIVRAGVGAFWSMSWGELEQRMGPLFSIDRAPVQSMLQYSREISVKSVLKAPQEPELLFPSSDHYHLTICRC